jgi:radical SAM superfamily enzyme YgiQ (UPF0313 family)
VTTVTGLRAWARKLLDEEIGTIRKDAPERVALVYPSPYHTGMSSLGYQAIYRVINERAGRAAERAFLPDDVEAWRRARVPLFTLESERPVGDFPVVAFSVAYELELAGVVQCLELAGIPPLAEDRDERHPFVLCGGPLTNSNPLPLAPFADAIVMGEAEETVHRVLDVVFGGGARADVLAALAREVSHVFVPDVHGDEMPGIGSTDDELLPAWAPIRTPNTELREMFLLEAERG